MHCRDAMHYVSTNPMTIRVAEQMPRIVLGKKKHHQNDSAIFGVNKGLLSGTADVNGGITFWSGFNFIIYIVAFFEGFGEVVNVCKNTLL